MDYANAIHWYDILVCARDAYNRCTRMLYDNKTSLSLKKVHETCYNTIRAEFPLLSSQMVIKCGKLDDFQERWFRKLYYLGL